ncbi:PD-(D/E)XK nuclease family protein [Dehalococcoidia bacterium]|nr:PD-(D/E)XK nuclease family protein [Dehalococcoidia bacterium]
MRWSFSSHKMFQRCQRQYYFFHIAANRSAKSDYVQREAYRLKQVKTLSTWKGSLIHQGINKFVIPYLQHKEPIDWDDVVNKTIKLAKKQFEFSRNSSSWKSNIVKDGYCILLEHERGEDIPKDKLDSVYAEICTCFTNLASQKDLLSYLQGQRIYFSEKFFSYQYEGAQIYVVPDLVFSRSYGYPTIVDWKIEQDFTHSQHKLQVALYAWVLWKNDGWGIKKLNNIDLYEIQLLKGNIIKHICDAEIIEELEDFIYQSIHEIRSLCGDHKYQHQDFRDYEPAKSPNTCLYCSFQKLCREVEQWRCTQLTFLK